MAAFLPHQLLCLRTTFHPAGGMQIRSLTCHTKRCLAAAGPVHLRGLRLVVVELAVAAAVGIHWVVLLGGLAAAAAVAIAAAAVDLAAAAEVVEMPHP